jgi:Flp pilus assembly protein TadD
MTSWKSFQKAPSMPTPDEQYDVAIRLKDEGKLEDSANTLLAIVAEAPNHTLSHSALAVVLQKLGKFDEAIAHAKTVVKLEPNDPFSFAQLSVICQRCGRIADAEDALARNQAMSGHHHRH